MKYDNRRESAVNYNKTIIDLKKPNNCPSRSSSKYKQKKQLSDAWLMHYNIRGFLNCKEEFELYLKNEECRPLVICLNEHWLIKENILMLNTLGDYDLV
jgi:hypothetical protein